jgi:hypothetical protein
MFVNSVKLLFAFPLLFLAASGQTQSGSGVGPGNPPANLTFVRILSRPQPKLPQEISRVPGMTIVLRAVFTSDARVTNVHFVKVTPEEAPRDTVKLFKKRAIEAAKQIKFTPATKDGRPVSMYVQLEYNFNAAEEESEPAATPPDAESKPEKARSKG